MCDASLPSATRKPAFLRIICKSCEADAAQRNTETEALTYTINNELKQVQQIRDRTNSISKFTDPYMYLHMSIESGVEAKARVYAAPYESI